ncbi:MAG: polymer-forming cytoskeletal protein [Myxococcota bacterium]
MAATNIGSSITITGSFTCDEDVTVEGKIQGEVQTTADLTVEPGGTLEAEVSVQSIDVRGTVVGNISASDRIELHPGSNVTGDIRAPRVVLNDGAKFKGRIDMDVN